MMMTVRAARAARARPAALPMWAAEAQPVLPVLGATRVAAAWKVGRGGAEAEAEAEALVPRAAQAQAARPHERASSGLSWGARPDR